VRLTVTYAGFEGESELLERLYKQGLQGVEIAPSLYRQKGLLMAWHHEPIAPWQTPEWVEQMRSTLRTNALIAPMSFPHSVWGKITPSFMRRARQETHGAR